MGGHKPQRVSSYDTSKSRIQNLDIPIQDLSVHKRVPATIHWATVDGIDRDDDEVIGEAIIYEDGTSDVIVLDNISDDAKKLVSIINGQLDHFSQEG